MRPRCGRGGGWRVGARSTGVFLRLHCPKVFWHQGLCFCFPFFMTTKHTDLFLGGPVLGLCYQEANHSLFLGPLTLQDLGLLRGWHKGANSGHGKARLVQMILKARHPLEWLFPDGSVAPFFFGGGGSPPQSSFTNRVKWQ